MTGDWTVLASLTCFSPVAEHELVFGLSRRAVALQVIEPPLPAAVGGATATSDRPPDVLPVLQRDGGHFFAPPVSYVNDNMKQSSLHFLWMNGSMQVTW